MTELENPLQYTNYGTYTSEPNTEQLKLYFTLSPSDLVFLERTRTPNSKLGMALQLTTLRFLGTFLVNPLNTPAVVNDFLSLQLGFDGIELESYATKKRTVFHHQELIRTYLGYQEFKGTGFIAASRVLLERLQISEENEIILFDLVTKTLLERSIVLPGATTITRLIRRARERIRVRLYKKIYSRLSKTFQKKLEQLLLVPKGELRSLLDSLRSAPTHSSSNTILAALERVNQIGLYTISTLKLEDIAENRLAVLIRYGLTTKVQTIALFSRERCLATLAVTMQHLEKQAIDDVLTIFDTVMRESSLRAQRRYQRQRLRSLGDLDKAALTLRDAARLVLDTNVVSKHLRTRILESIGESTLEQAVLNITELTTPGDDLESQAWKASHAGIARFINGFLETIPFEGQPSAKGLLEAITFAKRIAKVGQSDWGEPPRAFIPKAWLAVIFPSGRKSTKKKIDDSTFNRSAYIVCLAHCLHQALQRGEVYCPKAIKFGDPRTKLIELETWQAMKKEVLELLKLPSQANPFLDQHSKSLHDRLSSVAATIGENQLVKLKQKGDDLKISLTPLEPVPLSATQLELNKAIGNRLPEIALAEVLLELNARTGFITAMLEHDHLGQSQRHYAQNLETSLAAVLLSEACNIGLKSVAQELNSALKLNRLEITKARYLKAEGIRQANRCLVEYHSQKALSKQWGAGEVASADGLRFVVPTKNILSQANSRYFGRGRGITYYSLVSDQFTQVNGTVIPGTVRDSLYLLGTLLEQDTNLEPTEIMTDTAGYSDIVFGLFQLLGYRFSPRLKDIGKARFWRSDRKAKYGAIQDLVKHRINTTVIHEQWDEVLRLVGSLKLGKLKATDVTKVLARGNKLSGLGRAIQAIGRISKTIYLCDYLEHETYRRRIHTQLNHGELRHDVARHIFYGRKGKIFKSYQRGLEEQLGALGLVVNAVVVWNTDYMTAILSLLEAMGDDVLIEDLVRVTPLKTQHIKVLGEYRFELHPDVIEGDLRPLRDPNSSIGLEDEFEE
jgi:TnpA family transposase